MNNGHPSPPDTYDLLRKAVAARVWFHLKSTDAPRDAIATYGESLTYHIDMIIQKFRDGQREHGGDFRHCDMKSNRRQEIWDLINYECGEDMQPLNVKIKL